MTTTTTELILPNTSSSSAAAAADTHPVIIHSKNTSPESRKIPSSQKRFEDEDDATTAGSNISSLIMEMPTLATLADLAPVSLTDFNIHKRLQEGSGFQVFKVELNRSSSFGFDDDAPQFFSLKCLKNKSQSRESMEHEAKLLQEEAKMIQKLRHPNICQAVGLRSHNSFSYFLAYDLIEETLEDRIQAWKTGKGSKKPPPLEVRLYNCLLGVARAMMYMHARHIVNPLRPNGIGFDRSGRVKLFDFSVYGVASLEHMKYMSPEYILSQEASFESDVYSLGVILWQVATLKEPFGILKKFKNKPHSESRKRAIAKKLLSKRPSCSSIPDKELRALIKDCWDANPDARPSATRFLFRLAESLPKQPQGSNLDRIETLLRSHDAKMGRKDSFNDDTRSVGSAYNRRITR